MGMRVWVVGMAALLCCAGTGATRAQDLEQGLVAYYAFEDNVSDSGPNNHDGTAVGAPAYVAGVRGSAIVLDGVDDLVRFPGVPNATWDSAWTVAWYMHVDDLRRYSLFSKRGTCSVSQLIDVRMASTAPELVGFELSNGSATAVARGTLRAGAWVHVAVVRDGAAARVYVDGRPGTDVAAPTQSLAAVTAPMAFGDSPCVGFDGTLRYAGRIDELRVYDRALTAGEARALANAPTLTVSPGEGSAGATLRYSAANLALGQSYRLTMGGRGQPTQTLDTFTAASTSVARSFTVPSLAAGGYTLALQRTVFLQTVTDATLPFTVTAPLSISVSGQTPFRPGGAIAVAVTGLAAGTLELRYGGETMYGPIAVAAGTHTARLRIPARGPALPARVTLEAINRSGRAAAWLGSTAIDVAPRAAQPLALAPPSAPSLVPPRSAIPVSGQVTREDGFRPGTRLTHWWVGNDGQVFPLGDVGQFGVGGAYSVALDAPRMGTMSGGLALGPGRIVARVVEPFVASDLGVVQPGDGGGLGAFPSADRPPITTGRGAVTSNNLEVSDQDIPGRITITVRTAGGQPIPGAVVELSWANPAFSPLTGTRGSTPASSVSARSPVLASRMGPSQIDPVRNAALAELGVNQAPFVTSDCPGVLRRQVADAQGRVEFQLDLDAVQTGLGNLDLQQCNDGSCSVEEGYTTFGVHVYAAQQGFGIRDPVTEVHTPARFFLTYLYPQTQLNPGTTGQFQLDPDIGNVTAQLLDTDSPAVGINLPRLTGNGALEVVIENVNMPGLPRESAPPQGGNAPPGSNGKAWFAPKVDNPFPAPPLSNPGFPTWKMFFSHSQVIGGPLTGASFHIDLDGNGTLDPAGNFVLSTDVRGQCGLTQLDTYELPVPTSNSGSFGWQLRNFVERRPRSERSNWCGEIRATNQAGDMGRREVCFQLVPFDLATSVLAGDQVDLGTIRLSDAVPGRLTVGVDGDFVRDGEADLGGACNAGSGESCDLGPQENRTDNSAASAVEIQSIGGSGPGSSPLRGLSISDVTSVSASSRQFNRDSEEPLGGTVGGAAATQVIGSRVPVTVLDVSYPLFYYVFGVPPIGSLELGADIFIKAGYTLFTEIAATVDGTGKVDSFVTEALARQVVDAGIELYADLTILFDLVDGEFRITPTICAGIESGVTRRPLVNGLPVPGDPLPPRELARLRLPLSYEITIYATLFPVTVADEITLAEEGDTQCGVDQQAKQVVPRLNREWVAQLRDTFDAADLSLARTAYTVPDPSNLARQLLLVRTAATNNVVQIASAHGIRNVQLVAYAPNRFVLAWVQSANPPPTQAETGLAALNARLLGQHVRYAVFDGVAWGPAQQLTAPGTGEGGLSLAPCHASESGCGDGKVLATWTRMTTPDLGAFRTRVMRSEFTPGGGWTAPVALDGAGISDTHATAAYANGTAVVAWLRNGAGTAAGAENRSLAYRVLDGASPVRVAAGLPAGLTVPRLAAGPNGELALAFTRSEDARAFVGNRQAVHLAGVACAAGGNCTFSAVKLKDRRGRDVFADKPTPVFTDDGAITVAYRGVNYGVDVAGTRRNYTDDPLGIRIKTGELMMLTATPGLATVDPVAVSNDGAGYVNFDVTFDRSRGALSFAGIATNGLAAGAKQWAKSAGVEVPGARASAKVLNDAGLVVFDRPVGPDLALAAAVPSTLAPSQTQPLTLALTLHNAGTPYVRAAGSELRVVASWDEQRPAGGPAASVVLESLAAGASRTLNLAVPLPPGYESDEGRLLFVAIESAGASDVDAGNDVRLLTIGGMPVPANLFATTTPGLPFAHLSWDTLASDPRVKGYRVYVQEGSGPAVPLGASPIAGFVDLAAEFDVPRTYTVTTYSARGVESAPSEPIEVMPRDLQSDQVFRNGFEGPAP